MQFPGQNRKSTHQKSSGAVLSNSPELFINVIFSKFYFATDPFYFFKNKIIRTRPRINTAKMAMFITVLIAAGKYPDRRCDRPQYPGCDCRAEVKCPPKNLNLTLTTRHATINTQGEQSARDIPRSEINKRVRPMAVLVSLEMTRPVFLFSGTQVFFYRFWET